MYKIYLGLTSLLLITIFMSCDKEESYGAYKGIPKDLRYSEMVDSTFTIGDNYISTNPTVLTYGTTSFEIVDASSSTSIDHDVLMSSLAIDAALGKINIIAYSNLLEGDYSIDIKVTNDDGSTTFDNVYNFTTIVGAPTTLTYSPSIVSVYGNEVGEISSGPQVNGGGPYTYSFVGTYNDLSIDSLTGIISLKNELTIGDNEKFVEQVIVNVVNKEGEFTATEPYTVELIGNSLGKISYIMELITATSANYGAINCDINNLLGEVSDTISGELYTTTLTPELNGPLWNVNKSYWTNVFNTYDFDVKYDVSSSGEIKSTHTLGMKTTSTKVEAVSMINTPSVDLTNATEAYINIEGFKYYLDNDSNQFLKLMIVSEEEFNQEDVYASNWTVLDENISPLLFQHSGVKNPALESSIIGEGSSSINIPAEFLGKKIRVALNAVSLKPVSAGGSNLGRQYCITKLEVRSKI